MTARHAGRQVWWQSRLPLIASVLSGAALIAMAWTVSPVPDQDASYFVGASMSAAAGDGFVNRVDGLLWRRDPEGQARLIAYPIVWSSLLSMTGGTSVRRTAVAVACVSTVTLILLALLLVPFASREPIAAAIAGLAVVSFSSAFANGSMRPEGLSCGLLLLLALALPRLPTTMRREVLIGAFAGALAHVQLPLGLYAVLGWSCWMAFERPLRESVPRGIVVAGAAIVVFGIGLALHPYGGTAYLSSLAHSAARIPSEFTWHAWFSYWVIGVRFPGLLLPVLLGLVSVAWHLRPGGVVRPASPALLGIAALAGCALVLKDTVTMPSRWYESLLFLPMVYVLMVDGVRAGRFRGAFRAAFIAASVIALLVNSAGIGRRLVVWISSWPTEMGYAESRALLSRDLAQYAPHGIVAATPQAWMLFPDFRRACVVWLADDLPQTSSCRVLPRVMVMQQARRPAGLAAPQEVVTPAIDLGADTSRPGIRWRLLTSHFSQPPRTLARVLSPRASGWGFAVYIRAD